MPDSFRQQIVVIVRRYFLRLWLRLGRFLIDIYLILVHSLSYINLYRCHIFLLCHIKQIKEEIRQEQNNY